MWMTWKYPNDSIEKLCKLMVFVNLIMHQRCHIFQYDYSQMKLIFILKTITEWRVWHVIGDISYEFKKNQKKTTFHNDWKKDEKKPLGQGIGFIGYSEAGLTAWTCVVIYNILYLTTLNSTMFCVFNHNSHPALITPKCFSDKLILTSIYRNQLSSFYNNLLFTPRILISTSSKEETARNAWQQFTNQCMH